MMLEPLARLIILFWVLGHNESLFISADSPVLKPNLRGSNEDVGFRGSRNVMTEGFKGDHKNKAMQANSLYSGMKLPIFSRNLVEAKKGKGQGEVKPKTEDGSDTSSTVSNKSSSSDSP